MYDICALKTIVYLMLHFILIFSFDFKFNLLEQKNWIYSFIFIIKLVDVYSFFHAYSLNSLAQTNNQLFYQNLVAL